MITPWLGWFKKESAQSRVIVKGGIDFAREADPDWQVQLDRFNPPEEGLGRLVPWWDAGDRWQPIHRWIVLQVQPWHLVPEPVQRSLEGPHPRAGMTHRIGSRVYSTTFRGIDRLCYEAYHTLKARGIRGWPRRFWVVQGPNGGHPYRLTPSEESRWDAEGRRHYAPGELPYATFDRRVITAMTAYDLWQYSHGGDPKTGHVKAILRRQQADERVARKLAWDAQHNLIGELAPELRHAMRKDGLHYHRHRPVGVKPRRGDHDRYRDHFLNDLNTEIPA